MCEAGKPVVKGLEWRVFCSRSGNCEAKTPFGEYVIQSETDGWCLYLLNSDDIHTAHSTLDFAKAAAQADYEARVLSALSTPADIEPVAEVIMEQDYHNRGHFYKGKRHELKPLMALNNLPVGTKLYATPVVDSESTLSVESIRKLLDQYQLWACTDADMYNVGADHFCVVLASQLERK